MCACIKMFAYKELFFIVLSIQYQMISRKKRVKTKLNNFIQQSNIFFNDLFATRKRPLETSAKSYDATLESSDAINNKIYEF